MLSKWQKEDEMGEQRKQWTPDEIAAILRRVLKDRAEVSEVCKEFGCCPSQVFRWQEQLLTGAGQVFVRSRKQSQREAKAEKRVKELEAKLGKKNEVLAKLMEEHVLLKKELGDL
jgi:transposase-like protein